MIEMAIKDDITWRTIIVYVFIVLFGCLILAKACAVMTVEGEKWRNASWKHHTSTEQPFASVPCCRTHRISTAQRGQERAEFPHEDHP